MSIKYKLIQALTQHYKVLSLLILISFSQTLIAQITGGEIETGEKQKKEKKKRESINQDSLSGTTYFLTGLSQYSFRKFEDKSIYDIYSQRNDEEAIYNGGISFGVIMPFIGDFSLSLGLSYFGTGEQYNFKATDTDSIFHYKRVYMQLGLPLQLRYSYGDKFQVFGFAGVTPLNILNIRYQENYVREDGIPVAQELQLIKSGFTQFNVIASAGIGLNYNLDYVGFTIYPEYKRYLMNTYADVSIPLDHKMFAFALNFGLLLRM